MGTTPAYELGRVIGALTFSFVLLAAFAGYSVALWKYSRTRNTAWLVSTVFFSLPQLFMILLFFACGCMWMIQGARSPKTATSTRKEAVDLLREKFDTISGTNFDYTLEVPDLPEWKIDTKAADFDKIISYRDLYLGVIAERLGVGDTETLRKIVEKRLVENSTSHTITQAKSVTISGLPWLSFDVEATVQNIRLKYRYFIYADSRRTIQLLAWSSPALFDENSALVDEVAGSFRIGKN